MPDVGEYDRLASRRHRIGSAYPQFGDETSVTIGRRFAGSVMFATCSAVDRGR
jgi:hypothetical protein